MKLERINGVLFLRIDSDSCISFLEEWLEQLRALPSNQFNAFMRDTIYPALSASDRNICQLSKISTHELLKAIRSFR